MLVELYVVDDFSTGDIRVVSNLADIGHSNFIVHSRIRGVKLQYERWGISANEIMHNKLNEVKQNGKNADRDTNVIKTI